VSPAREKSNLTIRGNENPSSDKRGQKKLTVNTRIKTEIYATARFWSCVPWNGALPVRLNNTAVAADNDTIKDLEVKEVWKTYTHPRRFPSLQLPKSHIENGGEPRRIA